MNIGDVFLDQTRKNCSIEHDDPLEWHDQSKEYEVYLFIYSHCLMRVALLVIVNNLPRGPQSKLMYILKYSTSHR